MNHLANLWAKGLALANKTNTPIFEKSSFSFSCLVDDVMRQHVLTGLERSVDDAGSGPRNNTLNATFFKRIDVGSIINERGGD